MSELACLWKMVVHVTHESEKCPAFRAGMIGLATFA